MRLTRAELEAIGTALGFMLAGEPAESAGIEDEKEGERFQAALESAHSKVSDERRRRDERRARQPRPFIDPVTFELKDPRELEPGRLHTSFVDDPFPQYQLKKEEQKLLAKPEFERNPPLSPFPPGPGPLRYALPREKKEGEE